MIPLPSMLLRRLSRRHPAAARFLGVALLLGALSAILGLSLRDLKRGQWVRPAVALGVLSVAAVWLSWSGVARSLNPRKG